MFTFVHLADATDRHPAMSKSLSVRTFRSEAGMIYENSSLRFLTLIKGSLNSPELLRAGFWVCISVQRNDEMSVKDSNAVWEPSGIYLASCVIQAAPCSSLTT